MPGWMTALQFDLSEVTSQEAHGFGSKIHRVKAREVKPFPSLCGRYSASLQRSFARKVRTSFKGRVPDLLGPEAAFSYPTLCRVIFLTLPSCSEAPRH